MARWIVPLGSIDFGLLVLRLGFGLALSFTHGLPKLFSLEKFCSRLAEGGYPFPLLLGPAAMASELVGGLLLALGFFTRPAATLVLVTMLTAAFKAHGGEPFARKELALAYAVVALVLLITGPGRHSLAARLGRG
ncbi:MAG TPA: DoxX family protein [Polyangiaceae bacterium]|nr:DoxX family protein [Polyangiaceae bacterium]